MGMPLPLSLRRLRHKVRVYGQPGLLHNKIPSHTKMTAMELTLALTGSEKLPHLESSPTELHCQVRAYFLKFLSFKYPNLSWTWWCVSAIPEFWEQSRRDGCAGVRVSSLYQQWLNFPEFCDMLEVTLIAWH